MWPKQKHTHVADILYYPKPINNLKSRLQPSLIYVVIHIVNTYPQGANLCYDSRVNLILSHSSSDLIILSSSLSDKSLISGMTDRIVCLINFYQT